MFWPANQVHRSPQMPKNDYQADGPMMGPLISAPSTAWQQMKHDPGYVIHCSRKKQGSFYVLYNTLTNSAQIHK